MPYVWLPAAELAALRALWRGDAVVDWAAYDRVKRRLLHPQWASLDAAHGEPRRLPAVARDRPALDR